MPRRGQARNEKESSYHETRGMSAQVYRMRELEEERVLKVDKRRRQQVETAVTTLAADVIPTCTAPS